MNGKRVEFQKSVKTCSETLTKQPKKNIRTWNLFGMMFDNFGTIFGNFCGVPEASQERVPKRVGSFAIFGPFWKPLGTPLGGHVATKWAS